MLKAIKSSLFSEFFNIGHGTVFGEGLRKNYKYPVNFSYSVDDSLKNVDKNYRDFSNFVNISEKNIKRDKQTHSSIVQVVDDYEMPNYFYEADSLITNLPNICLSITTADCLPILIYAKDKNYIANIHAGWRGAKKGIIENTINKLISLGCNTKNIYAAIMPAINVESYEVSKDFYEDFILESKDSGRFFDLSKSNLYFFDLKHYAFAKLKKLGVNKVDILGYDSFNIECLFSHRSTTKNNGKAGRNLNYIMIND